MIKINEIKNKRGDIPITILVIGVLAICALAIFSFYTSSQKVKSGFDVVGVVERAVIESDKISLYPKLGFSENEIDTIFDIKSDELGRHIIIGGKGISVRKNIPD